MNEYEVFIEDINACGGEQYAKKELIEVEADSPEAYVKANGVKMDLTDEDGRTSMDGLDVGLYLVVETAVPEMVKSGHLKELEDQKYTITEKGRQDGAITEDSLAFTVRQSAENAVAKFNRQIRRSSYVKTQILPREKGDYSVVMSLDDDMGNLMTMELVAPDRRQATRLSRLFEKKAEAVYSLTMAELLDDEDELDEF